MTKLTLRSAHFSIAQFTSHLRTPLYRNAYALTLSSTATSGLGMVYWVLAARYYSAEVVGLNAAALSMVMFLAGIAQLNLMSALTRFIPQAGHATSRLVGCIYLLCTIVAVSLAISFAFSAGDERIFQGFLTTSPWSLAAFILSCVVSCIFTLQDSVLAGLRQTMWIPIENVLFAVTKIALLVLFAGPFQYYGIFASWIIPVAISLLPINILIFGWFIPKHAYTTGSMAKPIVLRDIRKYIVGNLLGSVFSLISSTFLPVIVTYKISATANAYFYQPWLIASAMQFVSINMATSLTVEGAFDETTVASNMRQALVNTAKILIPIVLITLVAAHYILSVFGEAYANEGANVLRLLSLSSIPNIIVTLYFGYARIHNQMTGIVIVQGLLCILVLAISYALIPSFGVIGVGIAFLASQTTLALVLLCTQLRSLFHSYT